MRLSANCVSVWEPEPMKLKTRPVAAACVAAAVVAVGLLIWQIAKSPGSTPSLNTTTSTTTISTPSRSAASGVVMWDPSPAPASAQAEAPAPAPPLSTAPAPSALAGRPATAAVQTSPPTANAPTTASPIKHPVALPQAARPPILPNEVNAVVAQTLGRKTLLRYFYLDPMARRFVASVDGLGRKPAPTDLWLLRPVPGALKVVKSSQQPDTRLLRKVNSQRYADLVHWIVRTDSATLVDLYARMYPLLQQTYVELGHPNDYFNDRVIEVIDLMLATPMAKPPLRLRPAREDDHTSSNATPTRPRFEFNDPALETMATGQKILLRVGPQNAALLKAKLQVLRKGLIELRRTTNRSASGR